MKKIQGFIVSLMSVLTLLSCYSINAFAGEGIKSVGDAVGTGDTGVNPIIIIVLVIVVILIIGSVIPMIMGKNKK